MGARPHGEIPEQARQCILDELIRYRCLDEDSLASLKVDFTHSRFRSRARSKRAADPSRAARGNISQTCFGPMTPIAEGRLRERLQIRGWNSVARPSVL